MEDPWKVFHPPSKDPPNLLPVSPNLKGKVRVWGTQTTSALEVFLNDMRYINPRFTYLLTNGSLGLQMVKKRFLTQKYKNN